MDEQRHVNLLEAYLDNRLTPNERRELEQLLRESATMRRLFWVYVQQHAFTWELLAEARGKNLALTESGVRSRESLVGGAGLSSGSSGAGGLSGAGAAAGSGGAGRPKTRRVANWRRGLTRGSPALRLAGSLAAAVLLLGVGLYLVHVLEVKSRMNAPDQPAMAAVDGVGAPGAVVVRNQTAQVLAAGMQLWPGDTVKTTAGGESNSGTGAGTGSGSGSDASAGWTQIEFSDGTILKLEPGTELEMTSMQDGKRLGLTRGRMSAVVAPQPAGQPMQVTTPQSLVTVVGTHFSLAVTGAATRLQVDEGHVRLMRTADLASVEVLRGQFVVAEAGMDLAVKPVEAGPVEVAAAPQQPEQRELPHDGAREEPRRPDDAEPARQPPHEPLAQEPAQEKPREGQPQEQWAGREPPPENPSLKDREHPPAPAPAPHEEVLGDHEAIGRVTEIASNHSSFQVQVQRAGNKEFVGRTVTFLANWVREGERTGPKEADVKLIHGLNVGDEVRVRWHIEEHFRIDAVTVLEHARTKPAGAHEEEHPAPHEAAPRHD